MQETSERITVKGNSKKMARRYRRRRRGGNIKRTLKRGFAAAKPLLMREARKVLPMLTRQAQRKLDQGITRLASRNKRVTAIAPLLRKAGQRGIDAGSSYGRKKLGGSFWKTALKVGLPIAAEFL